MFENPGNNSMFNGMNQNNPFFNDNYPTTKELWKKEKREHRVWIILFGISIFVVFGMLLSGVIVNFLNESAVKDHLKTWMQENVGYPKEASVTETVFYMKLANNFWLRNLIIVPSIKTLFVFIGLIYYLKTVSDSYKNKNFAHISKWSTWVIGIGAFMGFVQLFNIWNSPILSYKEGIFNFINMLLPVVIFVFVSIPLNKIRRSFQLAERIENFKKTEQYQNMKNQQQNFNNNPNQFQNSFFGSMSNQNVNKNNSNANNNDSNIKNNNSNELKNNEIKQKNQEEEKLNKMTLKELKEIAKKLYISGYYTMKKKELIESILRVTEKD